MIISDSGKRRAIYDKLSDFLKQLFYLKPFVIY
jgi:hypothetical protein